MKNGFFLYVFLIAVICADTFGVSKTIRSVPITTETIVEMSRRVQFIKPGDAYFDFNFAPIVAMVEEADHTITVYAPTMGNKDSLFFQFIPGNQIAISIYSHIRWDENMKCYYYDYTLFSDSSSILPIWYLSVEHSCSYVEAISPNGWMFRAIPSQNEIKWGDVNGSNQLLPGDSLTGFGFISHTPPTVAEFNIWGQNKELCSRYSGYDSITVDMLADIYGDIATKYIGLDGYLIVPDTDQVNIEPVDWFLNRLYLKLNILTMMGYIDQAIESDLGPILKNLSDVFKYKENQSLDNLEKEINTALTSLEPFRNQMEPEAQTFIFENLKYILRHQDIVKFKEYP